MAVAGRKPLAGLARLASSYQPNSDLLLTTTCKSNTTTVLTTTRSWETGPRLRSIVNVANNSVVTSHDYGYDALDRRKSAQLEDGSHWQYGYSDRDELTAGRRYWSDWSPVTGQQFEYNYDSIGNRTLARSGGDTNGTNLRETLYTANALNQYSAIATPGYEDILGVAIATNTVGVINFLTGIGGLADRKGEYFHREIAINNTNTPVWQTVKVECGGSSTNGGLVFPAYNQTLSYDADGNLTFDGIWNYQWDAENRLKAMFMTNTIAGLQHSNRLRLDFVYDFQGRRVSKAVSAWSGYAFTNASTTLFVYDGWNLIASLDSPSSVRQAYLWGQDLSGTEYRAGGVGGLFGVLEMSNNRVLNCHFTSYDGNGNPTALIRASDCWISARYDFSPYGETIRATGPAVQNNPFRFSTKFYDEETGLFYYGHRYYSPTLGRWINRDPMQELDGNNLVAFLRNNPINAFDPDGRFLQTLLAVAEGVGTEAVDALKGASAKWRIKTFVNRLQQIEHFKDGIIAASDMLGDPKFGLEDWTEEINDLKNQATKKPLGSIVEHKHHIIPRRLHVMLSSIVKRKIDPNEFLVRLEEKLHLKGLHGAAGGKFVELWKDGLREYKTEMRNPAFLLGFAFGAMNRLGLGDFALIP